MSSAVETEEAEKSGGLRMRDLILGIICSVFFIDTVAPISAMGASSLAWMFIIGIIFFFPGCLVVAELGSAYPENGGFYAWIKRAFGPMWGARIVWIYWAGNAIWISSAITLFVNVMCSVLHWEISLGMKAVMNIAVIWGIIYLATKPMEQSTGIVNFAAIVKILMAFALLVGAVVYIIGGGEVKNDFSSGELMPSYGEAMIFIPALIYNFLGFEIMSAAGGSIKNPARDVPRAAFVNVIMIITLNLIAVIGVLVVLPKDSVNIITGVIDAFRASFGETGLAAVVIYLIGFLYLCVLVAQSLMWMLGTAQVAVESAKNNEMPKVLAKIHPKNNTPTGSLIVGGVISTVVTTASTLTAGSAEQMFWAIFACTSILLLIPYFLCFEAYLKLKREDKETPRPYVFPGPDWLVKTLIRIAQFIILCTILFFVWVPGQPVEWTQVIFIAVGIILTLGSGEFLIRNSMRKNYSTNEVTE